MGNHPKELSPSYTGRYAQVSLFKNGQLYHRKVHLLVLETFVGPQPVGMQGCHNDGNCRNNYVGNLRWDTPQSNYNDRRLHGTANDGERNGRAKLTDKDVLSIREALSQGTKQIVLAEMYGVSQVKISQIKLGKAWRHLVGGHAVG